MNPIDDLLAELSGRLPELEWKLSGLTQIISGHTLPRGLFHPAIELTGAACIAEIKADIIALSKQQNQRSANFLAERIKQKINVLVAICQIESRKNKPERQAVFGINMLTTRQKWLQTIEQDINTLESQQQALTKALLQMKQSGNSEAILNVQKELGEAERRLTLAREAFKQAIS